MKRRSVLSWLLAAVGGTAIPFLVVGLAEAGTNVTDSPVDEACASTGQACDQAYHQTVSTTSVLTLEFQSSYLSCATFSVAFYVDGAQVYSSAPLAEFQSTGTFNAGPVAPGSHALEVRATGVTAGCDAGTLASWAGVFIVTTNEDPLSPPSPPPASGGPTSPEQCKQGGWQSFSNPSFKNQGQCVSFIEHAIHRDAR
jgi:hypothetical protein